MEHAFHRFGVDRLLQVGARAHAQALLDIALRAERAEDHHLRLQAVEQYRSLQPDLVLLDLVMPECDGRQALSRILAHDPQARVVILSSLGAQSDIEECLRMGARSYLQKPIDPEAMERVLHQVLA